MSCPPGARNEAERFDAKATVLIENVTHHIEEEEQDWFPKVRAGLSRKQLQELGAKLEQPRKRTAGLRTSSHHTRKLVGVEFSGVR